MDVVARKKANPPPYLYRFFATTGPNSLASELAAWILLPIHCNITLSPPLDEVESALAMVDCGGVFRVCSVFWWLLWRAQLQILGSNVDDAAPKPEAMRSATAVIYGRALLKRESNVTGQRWLSVKELSWCSGSPSSKNDTTKSRSARSTRTKPKPPIDRFSIIAAMGHPSRIIGINGNQLPWKPLREDRELFRSLTKDKLLILGRRTLEEQKEDLSHILHARHYIVVSQTLHDLEEYPRTNTVPHLAKSFPEALGIARAVADKEQAASTLDAAASFCWVVGGERLYNEAVKHPHAEAIHLSIVDQDRLLDHAADSSTVARFPPHYWWDHTFRLSSTSTKDGFTYKVFKRHRGFTRAESQ